MVRNLRSGLRVAAFQRVGAGDFTFGAPQVAAAAAVEVAAYLLHRLAIVGATGDLYAGDLPAILFHIPLFLLAPLLCCRRNRGVAASLPLALLGAAIPLHIVATLFLLVSMDGWLRLPDLLLPGDRYFPFFGWWVFSVALFYLRTARGARAGIVVLAVLLFLPLWYFPRGEVWLPRETPGADRGESVVSEEIFYLQPALLERRLAALKGGRQGGSDLYFVGLAGYGDEDVFGHEVEVISRLFDDRFGTRGRSVSLVNNPRTLRRDPIASSTSLAATLDHIGRIMNREEDTLFLYLTSHGSEDHELEVSLRPLDLQPVDPAGLREMLDASGIVWRVIVVSACYSGGFIDSLAEEHTLVITASDAEHNSFGCGSESDFTYFGKAYFDEELRRTYSFTEAFGKARESINRREKREKETPSNPQMRVGSKMAEHLERLEKRLREKAG